MNETFIPVREIARIAPGAGAERLATAMYDRLLAELERLTPEEWETMTVCAPWTIADVVRHQIGAAKGHASLLEMVRQARHGARHRGQFDGNDLDAMNSLQVADHADLGPAALLAELTKIAPRAVAKRMSRPRVMHKVRLPIAPGGSTASGMPESLTLGHLLTVVLTRDVFVHRMDVAQALARTLEVDAETEGRIVADVVGEWAERHGAPFRLTLSGPAGGHYVAGTDGPTIELDALEFCRVLSGRAPASHPLLDTRVLF